MDISEITQIVAKADAFADVVAEDGDDTVTVYTHQPQLGVAALGPAGYRTGITPYGFDVLPGATGLQACIYCKSPRCVAYTHGESVCG